MHAHVNNLAHNQLELYNNCKSPVKALCLSSGFFASFCFPAATMVSARELSDGWTCSFSSDLISVVTSSGLLCLKPCKYQHVRVSPPTKHTRDRRLKHACRGKNVHGRLVHICTG